MIRSMTGYGAAVVSLGTGRVRAEARSLNHRFLQIAVRLPEGWSAWETELRRLVAQAVERGAVHLALQWEGTAEAATTVVDRARLRAYRAVLAVAEEEGFAGPPSVLALASVLDRLVGIAEAGLPTDEATKEAALAAAREALAALRAQSEAEGARLAEDLRARLGRLAAKVAAIEARAPERLAAERTRLRAVVAELLGGHPVDEGRLLQEIALLAERWDIAEEVVRLRAHLAAANAWLAEGGAIGKRLGFLLQEMGREANTIGAKANDAVLAHRVVALKEELERLREQVENLE